MPLFKVIKCIVTPLKGLKLIQGPLKTLFSQKLPEHKPNTSQIIRNLFENNSRSALIHLGDILSFILLFVYYQANSVSNFYI